MQLIWWSGTCIRNLLLSNLGEIAVSRRNALSHPIVHCLPRNTITCNKLCVYKCGYSCLYWEWIATICNLSVKRNDDNTNTFQFFRTMYELALNCFAFISVGAGTSGGVLADRLTDNTDNMVLLVEAGGDPTNNPDIAIPILAENAWGSEYDWNYHTTPQTFCCRAHNDSVSAVEPTELCRIIEKEMNRTVGFYEGRAFGPLSTAHISLVMFC